MKLLAKAEYGRHALRQLGTLSGYYRTALLMLTEKKTM